MSFEEKLVLKIREDVETRTIEVDEQSVGVSEEEQLLFTEADTDTGKPIWERKKISITGLNVDVTVIQYDAISKLNLDEYTNFTPRLRRKNQILP